MMSYAPCTFHSAMIPKESTGVTQPAPERCPLTVFSARLHTKQVWLIERPLPPREQSAGVGSIIALWHGPSA